MSSLHSLDLARLVDPVSWEGNWPYRMLELVNKRGYENVSQAIRAIGGGISLERFSNWVLDQTGAKPDILQLEMIVQSEVDEIGDVDRYLMPALARALVYFIPTGWEVGADWPANLSYSFAFWSSLQPSSFVGGCVQVYLNLIELAPPIAWLPASVRDGLLELAFRQDVSFPQFGRVQIESGSHWKWQFCRTKS